MALHPVCRPVWRSTPTIWSAIISSQQRSHSTSAFSHEKSAGSAARRGEVLPPLSMMPTMMLLRSLMVTNFLCWPRLLTAAIPVMDKLSTSKLWVLNPDINPVLNRAVRFLFYDHFTAGNDEAEVTATIARLKDMGHRGVMLSFAKEVVAEHMDPSATANGDASLSVIAEWKAANMRTIGMLGVDDILAIKYTGAGDLVVDALWHERAPPAAFKTALEEIMEASLQKGSRVFIDAEQQCFQDTIDAWTLDLMRRYNTKEKMTPNGPLVYTTMQAYLKSTPDRLTHLMKVVQAEGWVLGVKLVRGAYLASEERSLIHDTKSETDAAYNGLLRGIVQKSIPGVPRDRFPEVYLFIAGHNRESVDNALAYEREAAGVNRPTVGQEHGQLLGMADELSCSLIQIGQQVDPHDTAQTRLAPRAFKATVWGTPQECMQWLLRRAVENRAAVDRAREWQTALRKEVWRRIKRSFC